jgi:hypothetical protein
MSLKKEKKPLEDVKVFTININSIPKKSVIATAIYLTLRL